MLSWGTLTILKEQESTAMLAALSRSHANVFALTRSQVLEKHQMRECLLEGGCSSLLERSRDFNLSSTCICDKGCHDVMVIGL